MARRDALNHWTWSLTTGSDLSHSRQLRVESSAERQSTYCTWVDMTLKGLIQCLGDEVHSVEEETFELFSQDRPSQNLGFIDSKSQLLEITVGGRDLAIHQSPAILSSNRAGGTTGAVVWKITPAFADWIRRSDNVLFANGILTSQSTVIELGCGISAVVGLLLASKISSYVLTDQPYVSRLVEQNIEENRDVAAGAARKAARSSGGSSRKPRARDPRVGRAPSPVSGRLSFRPLDWETDTADPSLTGSETVRSFDAVLCCDCIYNEALVEPLVQTCADICRLRADESAVPCVCIVAQQLRDPDVFEAWLARFARDFDVWRVPDAHLVQDLRSNSGFAVHIGILKGCSGEASSIG